MGQKIRNHLLRDISALSKLSTSTKASSASHYKSLNIHVAFICCSPKSYDDSAFQQATVSNEWWTSDWFAAVSNQKSQNGINSPILSVSVACFPFRSSCRHSNSLNDNVLRFRNSPSNCFKRVENIWLNIAKRNYNSIKLLTITLAATNHISALFVQLLTGTLRPLVHKEINFIDKISRNINSRS